MVNSTTVKEACWAISNITAGPVDHIVKFLESAAFERIMQLAKSNNIDNKKEALWVLCNAITGCDHIVRQ